MFLCSRPPQFGALNACAGRTSGFEHVEDESVRCDGATGAKKGAQLARLAWWRGRNGRTNEQSTSKHVLTVDHMAQEKISTG